VLDLCWTKKLQTYSDLYEFSKFGKKNCHFRARKNSLEINQNKKKETRSSGSLQAATVLPPFPK